jgi:hypothetical protein
VDESESPIASVFEHTAEVGALVDRAISGRGWALVISSDGCVVALSASKRQNRRETVRTIMRMHDRGMTPVQIAHELQEQGVPTARGGRWAHQTIGSVIARESR